MQKQGGHNRFHDNVSRKRARAHSPTLTHTHTHTHTQSHTHTLTHTHSYSHTNTQMHSHTHTHAHAHTHSHSHTHTITQLILTHTQTHTLTLTQVLTVICYHKNNLHKKYEGKANFSPSNSRTHVKAINVWRHSFLTLAIDRGERSISHSDHLTPEKNLVNRRSGGFQSQSGYFGFEPRTFQHVT